MNIIRSLKSSIIELLLPKNNFVTDKTAKNDILSLIHRLAPVTTSHALVRLGPSGDGGYLVPDDLEGIEACFSPGVSSISGFEKDCANMGMNVFLADKSVEKPAESHDRFSFTKKFIGAICDEEYITIDEWVNSSVDKRKTDLLLQIDIEGYEYETILNCSSSLMDRFRVIVVEFHGLDQLWNKYFFKIILRVFDKILQRHTCVHIHPNNYYKNYNKYGLEIPPLAEFTFLRNDRVDNPVPARVFPHALDFDNTENDSQTLPRCWFSK